jgi:hypothetical protein
VVRRDNLRQIHYRDAVYWTRYFSPLTNMGSSLALTHFLSFNVAMQDLTPINFYPDQSPDSLLSLDNWSIFPYSTHMEKNDFPMELKCF